MKLRVKSYIASMLSVLCICSVWCSNGFALEGAPASFAPLVEAAMPAVVNISTTQNIDVRNPLDDLRSDLPEGSPLDQFFRDFLNREFGMPEARKRKATSLGSGFLINAEGHIVTNAHVIDGADEVNVTLSNDSEKNFVAKVIGIDKRTDLAVLKIQSSTPLPYLKFGDSDKARVGDWIIAIGNPFGLGGTVTAGIISAKSRLIGGQYDEFIQTDASINRGNSGGPMINMNGEVIGINSVIISPSGGNIGIGFSIPSNQTQQVIAQLKASGKVVRGWLGVGIQSLTEEIARNIGIPTTTKGILVTQVMKDSPAEKVGIKPGDVIISFDGTPITQPQKLSRFVADTKAGKKVVVDIIRDGKPLKLTATVELLDNKFDDEPKKQKEPSASSIDSNLGIKMENLSAALRSKFKIDSNVNGAIISGVGRGSLAADAGLLVGDVVMQVNKVKVTSVDVVVKEIERAKKAGSKDIVLLVNRGGSSSFIVVELE